MMSFPSVPSADDSVRLGAAPVLASPGGGAAARAAQAIERLAQARGFIVDLDGTLVASGQALPGAARLLAYGGERCVIVSNNSRDTARSLSRKLKRIGLRITPEHIVLAGEQAVLMVARRYPGARIRLAASATLAAFARRQGCVLVEHAPDVVILGRDVHFNYAKLAAIVNDVRGGARLIVTNPDLSHPTNGGGLVPETGSLMRAVIGCAGVAPEQIVGKPEQPLFIEALQRLGTPAASTLVIGDNPATDAAGAARLGMPMVLVGASECADVASLAALFPSEDGEQAQCRRSSMALQGQGVKCIAERCDESLVAGCATHNAQELTIDF
jgi:HAD superfamily hydrolase (TIGR01450 family)